MTIIYRVLYRQLPNESRRFNSVDALWRKTLLECSIDANFMTQADPDKRLEEKFKSAIEKLEVIVKGFFNFLKIFCVHFYIYFKK